MPGLNDRFLDRENFYLAFKKVSYFLNQGNEWFDPILLAEYEASLPSHIHRLMKGLEQGVYAPKPIQPLPFPKRNSDEGKHRLRPYFSIDLDIQLIWVAITNVVSTFVEVEMPFWSYGNRLYRPIWFEEINGATELKKGAYTNSSPHIYRKWNQSWPLYKRHISLTIKTISKTVNFSPEEIEDEKELAIYQQSEKTLFKDCPYLNGVYWKQNSERKVFWSSIDLARFFPSINPQKIVDNLRSCLIKSSGEPRDDCSKIFSAVETLLNLQIDSTGWTKRDLSGKDGFALNEVAYYQGIPTGLVAGGFLANLALLDIDKCIDTYIKNNKTIAVFKYVDDHIILSQTQQGLVDFLNFYNGLLKEFHPSVNFQHEKTEPANVWKYGEDGFDLFKTRAKALELDIDFPSPLMTDTLRKVSHIANIEFELLEDAEMENLEVDLRHLLVTDFPATEIRKDTKMSFAAGKLCRLAAEIKPNFIKIDCSLSSNHEIIETEIKTRQAEYESMRLNNPEVPPLDKKKLYEDSKISFLQKALEVETKIASAKHKKIFILLKKTLRDNSDKVKLWKKSVEFCFQTGYSGLQELLGIADTCEVHLRSRTFLKVYILQTIQIKVAEAANHLNSDEILFWRSYCLKNFITEVLKLDTRISPAENSYPFVRQTLKNLSESIDFIKNEMLGPGGVLISQANPNYSKKTLSIKNQKNGYYSERIVWYFGSKYFWPEKRKFFVRAAKYLDLYKPISWSILCFFPELIPPEVIIKITSFIPQEDERLKFPFSEMANLTSENGFSYEMLKRLSKNNPKIYQKVSGFYPAIHSSLKRKSDKFITLEKWLERVIEQNMTNSSLDPRLSEWTQIEIVRRICLLIKNKIDSYTFLNSPFNNLEFNFIHPSNYLIPVSWAANGKMRWSDWHKLMNRKKMKFAPKTSLIDDYRFFPASEMWQNHINIFFGNPQIALIMGMSVLLVKLISKHLDWPPAANKLVFIDKLFANIYTVIEKENFSSDLRILLNAIFSKNDHNTMNQHENIEFGQNKISDIGQFASYLKKIQNKLLAAQWDMTDKEPRQLVYVNIDDLNNSRDKFFEAL